MPGHARDMGMDGWADERTVGGFWAPSAAFWCPAGVVLESWLAGWLAG